MSTSALLAAFDALATRVQTLAAAVSGSGITVQPLVAVPAFAVSALGQLTAQLPTPLAANDFVLIRGTATLRRTDNNLTYGDPPVPVSRVTDYTVDFSGVYTPAADLRTLVLRTAYPDFGYGSSDGNNTHVNAVSHSILGTPSVTFLKVVTS